MVISKLRECLQGLFSLLQGVIEPGDNIWEVYEMQRIHVLLSKKNALKDQPSTQEVNGIIPLDFNGRRIEN